MLSLAMVALQIHCFPRTSKLVHSLVSLKWNHGSEMDLFTFHDTVLCWELNCVRYLQENGVLQNSVVCPGKNDDRCTSNMLLVQRSNKSRFHSMRWRCSKNNCRVERSVRMTNLFFKFESSKGAAGGKCHSKKYYTFSIYDSTQIQLCVNCKKWQSVV